MNPIVEFRGICKSFHGVKANADLHLQVKKGTIHAIVGENGAGKSTAMKILYGTYQPDSGEIYLDGKLWGGRMKPWSSPSDAIHCGIGMVHQHFMLGAPQTALENILLGVEPSPSWSSWLPFFLRPIDYQAARIKLNQISAQYGMKVDLDAKIENTSVGVQQRIEILKLLYRDANILILDEPTAVLTQQETEELFTNLRKLCQQGKTILIITHKLKEVMNLASRVTVFRRGRVVAERDIGRTSVEELATLMVGRKVNLQGAIPSQPKLGELALEVKNLSLDGHCSLRNLDLHVHGGEILGIAGVEGNGQTELLQALLHPKDQSLKGSLRLLGQDVSHFTADRIRSLCVGVIPEDRHREGLLLKKSVQENFLLGLQRRPPFYNKGLISTKKLTHEVRRIIDEYDIRPKSADVAVSTLSGGNQQKLIIAREFEFPPRFLIAAQPTRGVDVGAIESIHRRLLDARQKGCGILLISSELDEILALSDRILVMYEGKIVAEFQRGQVTEQVLGLRMGGASA
ncbi:MAG: ABC transporter ATP-binding protein [Bdellovibrionia bacterium]